MQDADARTRIASVLERRGWTVSLQPTGFHLLEVLAGVIDDHRARSRPELIVIDARSRGCAGTTIAAGLRDLGITIPIVLVTAPGDALPVSPDDMLRVVDSGTAEHAVAELARMHAAPPVPGIRPAA
jgi:FixJ family two-component response regulator